MHASVMTWFTSAALTPEEITGKQVLEIGALDVNGSVRPIIENHGPASYLGVDAAEGPRVDQVVNCEQLTAALGTGCADIVVSTEMLEHVGHWQACVTELARAVRPGGLLVVTTRSPGFPYHPHPVDTWRYTPEAFHQILDALGLETLVVIPDPEQPGVFIKARKPRDWSPPAGDPVALLAGVGGVTPMTGPP